MGLVNDLAQDFVNQTGISVDNRLKIGFFHDEGFYFGDGNNGRRSGSSVNKAHPPEDISVLQHGQSEAFTIRRGYTGFDFPVSDDVKGLTYFGFFEYGLAELKIFAIRNFSNNLNFSIRQIGEKPFFAQQLRINHGSPPKIKNGSKPAGWEAGRLILFRSIPASQLCGLLAIST
jgi:hypothetical protein